MVRPARLTPPRAGSNVCTVSKELPESRMAGYEHHVFICENVRPEGHPRGCCSSKGGAAVRARMKESIAGHGLKGRVRANMAGCLDRCEHGVSVVVYPAGVWYGGVTVDDVEEIVERHLLRGEVVERLLMPEKED